MHNGKMAPNHFHTLHSLWMPEAMPQFWKNWVEKFHRKIYIYEAEWWIWTSGVRLNEFIFKINLNYFIEPKIRLTLKTEGNDHAEWPNQFDFVIVRFSPSIFYSHFSPNYRSLFQLAIWSDSPLHCSLLLWLHQNWKSSRHLASSQCKKCSLYMIDLFGIQIPHIPSFVWVAHVKMEQICWRKICILFNRIPGLQKRFIQMWKHSK